MASFTAQEGTGAGRKLGWIRLGADYDTRKAGFMTRATKFRPEQLDASVYLAQGAIVVGDVTIGADSSVWFHAVLRGDTTPIRIGCRSNVQDGCILHADPGFPCEIGDDVTIGHAAIVHGAKLGNNVVVGMRAVVMNGAEIGANCIVGAGAVVPPGFKAAPGSLLIGVPAMVKRKLGDAEIAGNQTTAQHYVEAAREYKAGDA